MWFSKAGKNMGVAYIYELVATRETATPKFEI
jgi:hypothetical protein